MEKVEKIYEYLTKNLTTDNAKLWVYDNLDIIVELMNDKEQDFIPLHVTIFLCHWQNCIAILISKNFDNEKLLDNTRW